MDCSDALARIPRYLDDELLEAEAAPLRAHLMDCVDCRGQVQEARSVSAWLVKPEPVEVPAGFAALVARRAIAGDPGALTPVADVAAGPAPLTSAPAEGDRMRSFVVSAVAVAALVLLALSIALRRMDMPENRGLSADDASTDQALEALRKMNERDQSEDPKE